MIPIAEFNYFLKLIQKLFNARTKNKELFKISIDKKSI